MPPDAKRSPGANTRRPLQDHPPRITQTDRTPRGLVIVSTVTTEIVFNLMMVATP